MYVSNPPNLKYHSYALTFFSNKFNRCQEQIFCGARLDSSSDAQSMERNAGSLAECEKKRTEVCNRILRKRQLGNTRSYREIDYIDKITRTNTVR